MGAQSLKSHIKSKKHHNVLKVMSKIRPILFTNDGASFSSTFQNNTQAEITNESLINTELDPEIQKKSSNLNTFVLNDSVSNPETIWFLQTAMPHSSLNSCNQVSGIFQLMFQDSAIAKKLTRGRTKVSYIINHDLAPYYKDLKTLAPSFCYCSFFYLMVQ